jgi:CrcB protein
MKQVLLVGAGGAIGSMLRFLAGLAAARLVAHPFPWGTLAINVAGCLAMGALVHFVSDRGILGADARAFAAAGILGGFTTFSAFSQESLDLLERRHYPHAVGYILASVALGLAAAWTGRAACRACFGSSMGAA